MVCAACATEPVTPAALPAPALTPQAILQMVEATYAGAHSYVDHGTQLTSFSGKRPFTQHKVFATAFERGGRFRFEYRAEMPGDDFIIWSDSKGTLSSWGIRPGVKQESSLGHAIAAATGVSGSTAHWIPSLLVPELGGRALTRLGAPVRDPDDVIGGHPCWQISERETSTTLTLWIDTQLHLVRQIRLRRHLDSPRSGAFDVDELTSYEPSLDVAVDGALLQPPDSHGVPPTPRDQPPWLGIMFDGHAGTSRVQSVVPEGPAAHAGMQAGDVVTTIGPTATSKASEVIAQVQAQKPGTKLHVVVSRNGHDVPLDITLEARPAFDQLQHKLVDKPAPDFAFAPLSGAPIKGLADLRGHVAIVDFWATWCGPCAMAMPHLVELGHKYKDLRIVGISDEDTADITKYVADHAIDYTIARDADDVITGHYLVTGLPTLVIIDKAGVVRALHVGAGDFDAIEAEVQQLLK